MCAVACLKVTKHSKASITGQKTDEGEYDDDDDDNTDWVVRGHGAYKGKREDDDKSHENYEAPKKKSDGEYDGDKKAGSEHKGKNKGGKGDGKEEEEYYDEVGAGFSGLPKTQIHCLCSLCWNALRLVNMRHVNMRQHASRQHADSWSRSGASSNWLPISSTYICRSR